MIDDKTPLQNFFKSAPQNIGHNHGMNLGALFDQMSPNKDHAKGRTERAGIPYSDIYDGIAEVIGEDKYNHYFKGQFCVQKIENETIFCTTINAFSKTLIEDHYFNILEDIIHTNYGDNFKLQIDVLNENTPKTDIAKETAAKPNEYNVRNSRNVKDFRFSINQTAPTETITKKKTLSYGDKIELDKTFNNFIVGPSNQMAFSCAKTVAASPGEVYPTLYIHSASGLGKSHLAHAIANQLRTIHVHKSICFITARNFMNELVKSIQEKRIDQFRNRYLEKVDILIIEDIQDLKNKVGTQNELLHIFNQFYAQKKQLVFTADVPPNEITGVDEKVQSRLGWGLVVDIKPAEFETRIEIVKDKALKNDIYFPEEVTLLIAQTFKKNIREIESALIRLSAYASIFNTGIDTKIAKEQLNIDETKIGSNLKIEDIAGIVADHFSKSVEDLCSQSRKKDTVTARHISMHLAYQLLEITFSEIGAFFGGRDHSSVTHALNKVKQLSKKDPRFHHQLAQIEGKLSLSTNPQ